MQTLKRNDTNELIKNKQIQTHRLREQTFGYWQEGIVREFGMDMYALLYLKGIINKDSTVQGSLLNVMWQAGREGSF